MLTNKSKFDQHKKILKIIRLILTLGLVALLFWLTNKNFAGGGNLVVQATFGKDKPMISQLGPESRLRTEADYQTVLDDQVYFDLRSMPWFSKIRVSMVFLPVSRSLDGLGAQTGPGWQYDVKKPLLVSDLGAGWQKAVFDFERDKVYHSKNVERFLILTKPTNQTSGELKIKSIEVILSR
ncbi:MAG: hypothetical protein WCW26_01270 [Candidatus Buchananbacteria bacterium]